MYIYDQRYRAAEDYAHSVYHQMHFPYSHKEELGIFLERVVDLMDSGLDIDLSQGLYRLQKESIQAIKEIVDPQIEQLKQERSQYRGELRDMRPSGIKHDDHAQEMSQKKQKIQADITTLAQSVHDLKEHMKNLMRIVLHGRDDLSRRSDIFERA